MHKGKSLEFHCRECNEPISFSLFEIEKDHPVHCNKCSQSYQFDDPTLIRQLQKFEALCRQIQESEEILGTTAVGIDIGTEQVKIPFKLLLCRLRSCLDLKVGGKPFTISFRFEPLSDYHPGKTS